MNKAGSNVTPITRYHRQRPGSSSSSLGRHEQVMREVPKELWSEVLEVVTAITWGPDGNEPDSKVSEAGLAQLRIIYARQESLGEPAPFLTEAIADYTDDPSEAASLYRRALMESVGYPDEPTHTKRICLAQRLIELGDLSGARSELVLGRVEAERLNDSDYVVMADELFAKVTVKPAAPDRER
jgi:hypothetical protein